MQYDERLSDMPIDPPTDFYGADYGDWYAENEDKLVRDYVDLNSRGYATFLSTDKDGKACLARKDSEEERIEFCGLDEADFDRWCEQEYYMANGRGD